MSEQMPPDLPGLAEAAGQAWGEIAPLLHPEVALFLRTLTGQVLWLCKRVSELQAQAEAIRPAGAVSLPRGSLAVTSDPTSPDERNP